MTLKVIQQLQAFSNAIRRIYLQHFTRFELTVCWVLARFLCISRASCFTPALIFTAVKTRNARIQQSHKLCTEYNFQPVYVRAKCTIRGGSRIEGKGDRKNKGYGDGSFPVGSMCETCTSEWINDNCEYYQTFAIKPFLEITIAEIRSFSEGGHNVSLENGNWKWRKSAMSVTRNNRWSDMGVVRRDGTRDPSNRPRNQLYQRLGTANTYKRPVINWQLSLQRSVISAARCPATDGHARVVIRASWSDE